MERYQNNLQDQFGNAISGVTVTVRRVSDGGIATLFSDDGVTGKANPFTNDADGELFFYALNDRYDIFFTGPITEQKDDILLDDPATAAVAPQAVTIRILTDIATATPAVAELVTGYLNFWDLDNDTELARVGFLGNQQLSVYNLMRGGPVRLIATDVAGTFTNIMNGDPDGACNFYYAGDITLRTQGFGIDIADSTGGSDPFFGMYDAGFGTRQGYLIFNNTIGTQLVSEQHGLPISLRGEDAGGTVRELFIADPDGAFELYHAGGLRASSNTVGRFLVHSDGDTDTEQRGLNLCHLDGTVRGGIGYLTDGVLTIRNLIHGHGILLTAEDAGGNPRTILSADPDSTTILRADTNISLQINASENCLHGVANAEVQLMWNAQENFRTADESVGGMGAEVRHHSDNFYPVGMNVAPPDADLDSGNVTLGRSNGGFMITYDSATARNLNFNDNSNIPIGLIWGLKVGPSAGTLTGNGGAGVQINWWNGTSYTTTAAAGNITIGEGGYSIWKETDTLFWIEGPTLS